MSMSVRLLVLFFTVAMSSGQLLADDFDDGWAAVKTKDFATAIRLFTNVIEQDQDNDSAFIGRGYAYRSLGELDNAIADYEEAIRLDPTYSNAFVVRGGAWYAKGEYNKAFADYDEAIRLDPNNADHYISRGCAWFSRDLEKALADFNEAIRLDPTDASAVVNRGNAWHDMGQFDRAMADYDDAIRLDAEGAEAHNHRAWLRATCWDKKYLDGEKAVVDATNALELSVEKDCGVFDTLAAAYAESGQFKKAVESQKKAVELAPKDQKDDFRTRLKLYKEGKPYREEPKKK